MKRAPNPDKPRRKWKPSGSPGKQTQQAKRRRWFALSPEGDLFAKIRKLFDGHHD